MICNQERDDEICRLYKDGFSTSEIGEKYDLSKGRICQILDANGARRRGSGESLRIRYSSGRLEVSPIVLANAKAEKFPQRNAEMLALRAQGLSFNEIARKLRITRNTVAGVCHRAKASA